MDPPNSPSPPPLALSLDFARFFPGLVAEAQRCARAQEFHLSDRAREILENAIRDHNMHELSHMLDKFSGDIATHTFKLFVTLFYESEQGIWELQQLTHEERNILYWAFLFHDVCKEIHNSSSNPDHPFLCAGRTAMLLLRLGLGSADHVHEYCLALQAARIPMSDKFVHDNSKLPSLFALLSDAFPRQPGAVHVLQAIMLHQSLHVCKPFVPAAPLTMAEACQLISPRLFAVLRALMLADSGSYCVGLPSMDAHVAKTRAGLRAYAQAVCGERESEYGENRQEEKTDTADEPI